MSVFSESADADLRAAAIAYVQQRAATNGGVVTRQELEEFVHLGQRLPLIDPSRGIRNPRQLPATLSIMSSPRGPYDDRDLGDGLLFYAYRTGPIDQGDNRKLRRAVELGVPLIFLRKLEHGGFFPIAPAFLIDDDPIGRTVTVALDVGLRQLRDTEHLSEQERRYAHRVALQRLHQPLFRARVLQAYERVCAMCRLRHVGLLDAAHIIGDSEEGGAPSVDNGISLCKIHHAAYDQNLLGVRPDLTVAVRPDLLIEIDGPMLRHGIQELDGATLAVPTRPRERPDRERLRLRYDRFLAATDGPGQV